MLNESLFSSAHLRAPTAPAHTAFEVLLYRDDFPAAR